MLPPWPTAVKWTLLKEYFPDIRGTPIVDDINTISNDISLDINLHRAFGSMKVAFEATVSNYWALGINLNLTL
jgi:hypothetical protein